MFRSLLQRRLISPKRHLLQVRCLHVSRIFARVPKDVKAASDQVHDRLTDRRDLQQKSATFPNLASEPSKQMQAKEKLFFRLLDYLPGYEKAVSKIVPEKFVQVSRLFIRGVKLIFQDMKSFSSVHSILSGTQDPEKACLTMSRQQLEIYETLPRDLLRVGPVIVLSALPMAQYAVFPIALMYPKKLLSHHFWTEEQKRDALREVQRDKHKFYRCVRKIFGCGNWDWAYFLPYFQISFP